MATLSLAMIVKDESESIQDILGDAATFCDELVVVDTGSTDRTKYLAESAGARTVDFEWVDDFAAARNASFDACTSDWIIWLDADDRVPTDVQHRLRDVKATLLNDDRLDVVMTPYRYRFADDGRCLFSFMRERLIRRDAGLRWDGRVHEVITVPSGRSARRDDLYIEHRPSPRKDQVRGDRNLRILERAVADGDNSLRTRYYYGNELRDHGRYSEALAAYQAFVDGGGTGFDLYSARVSMATCERHLGRLDAALFHAHEALLTDASRAEAFQTLGEIYFDRERWAAAAPFFHAATICARPDSGFISDPVYSYLPYDYLGVCLSKLGRHSEACSAFVESLVLGNPDRDRIHSNLRFSTDELSKASRG